MIKFLRTQEHTVTIPQIISTKQSLQPSFCNFINPLMEYKMKKMIIYFVSSGLYIVKTTEEMQRLSEKSSVIE